MSRRSNVQPLKEKAHECAAADAALTKCHGLLTDVVIVGVTRDGMEFFGSSDNMVEPDVLWRLARAQQLLLESVDE